MNYPNQFYMNDLQKKNLIFYVILIGGGEGRRKFNKNYDVTEM